MLLCCDICRSPPTNTTQHNLMPIISHTTKDYCAYHRYQHGSQACTQNHATIARTLNLSPLKFKPSKVGC